MSMQDGYLTLLAYDDSLARRRKRMARQRHRKFWGSATAVLTVLSGLVYLATGSGLI